MAGAKASANYLVNSAVKASLILGFGLTIFDSLFKIATICLGYLAISLALVLLFR